MNPNPPSSSEHSKSASSVHRSRLTRIVVGPQQESEPGDNRQRQQQRQEHHAQQVVHHGDGDTANITPWSSDEASRANRYASSRHIIVNDPATLSFNLLASVSLGLSAPRTTVVRLEFSNVSVERNAAGESGLATLFTGLSRAYCLKEFILCDIGPLHFGEWRLLADALSTHFLMHKTLRNVEVSGTSAPVHQNVVEWIARACATSPALKRLCFHRSRSIPWKRLGLRNAIQTAQRGKDQHKVQLRNCALHVREIRCIALAYAVSWADVRTVVTLSLLDLSNNKIGNEGVGVLIESGVLRRARECSLRTNGITNDGWRALVDYITNRAGHQQRHRQRTLLYLGVLHLEGNNINSKVDLGAKAKQRTSPKGSEQHKRVAGNRKSNADQFGIKLLELDSRTSIPVVCTFDIGVWNGLGKTAQEKWMLPSEWLVTHKHGPRKPKAKRNRAAKALTVQTTTGLKGNTTPQCTKRIPYSKTLKADDIRPTASVHEHTGASSTLDPQDDPATKKQAGSDVSDLQAAEGQSPTPATEGTGKSRPSTAAAEEGQSSAPGSDDESDDESRPSSAGTAAAAAARSRDSNAAENREKSKLANHHRRSEQELRANVAYVRKRRRGNVGSEISNVVARLVYERQQRAKAAKVLQRHMRSFLRGGRILGSAVSTAIQKERLYRATQVLQVSVSGVVDELSHVNGLYDVAGVHKDGTLMYMRTRAEDQGTYVIEREHVARAPRQSQIAGAEQVFTWIICFVPDNLDDGSAKLKVLFVNTTTDKSLIPPEENWVLGPQGAGVPPTVEHVTETPSALAQNPNSRSVIMCDAGDDRANGTYVELRDEPGLYERFREDADTPAAAVAAASSERSLDRVLLAQQSHNTESFWVVMVVSTEPTAESKAQALYYSREVDKRGPEIPPQLGWFAPAGGGKEPAPTVVQQLKVAPVERQVGETSNSDEYKDRLALSDADATRSEALQVEARRPSLDPDAASASYNAAAKMIQKAWRLFMLVHIGRSRAALRELEAIQSVRIEPGCGLRSAAGEYKFSHIDFHVDGSATGAYMRSTDDDDDAPVDDPANAHAVFIMHRMMGDNVHAQWMLTMLRQDDTRVIVYANQADGLSLKPPKRRWQVNGSAPEATPAWAPPPKLEWIGDPENSSHQRASSGYMVLDSGIDYLNSRFTRIGAARHGKVGVFVCEAPEGRFTIRQILYGDVQLWIMMGETEDGQENHIYYVNTEFGDSLTPPEGGWILGQHGKEPAPIIVFQNRN